MLAGEDACAGRATDGVGTECGVGDHALFGESIDSGCRCDILEWSAIGGDGIDRVVVRKEEDDVGFFSSTGQQGKCHHGEARNDLFWHDENHRSQSFAVNGLFGGCVISGFSELMSLKCGAECGRMQILRFVFLAILCLCVQACIQGEEDIWIEANGSARVKAVYRVPALLLSESEAEEFRQTVEEEVGANKNLRLVTNTVDTEQGKRVIRLGIETDDITQLEHMLTEHGPSEVRTKADKILHAILGSIEIETQGLGAAVRREVDLKPLLDEYVGDRAPLLLSDAEFRYAVHLPRPAEESNAHGTGNEGRTLKWSYRLAELKGAPIVMTLKGSVPVPWWVYTVAVVVVGLVVWAVYCVLRKRSRDTVAKVAETGA